VAGLCLQPVLGRRIPDLFRRDRRRRLGRDGPRRSSGPGLEASPGGGGRRFYRLSIRALGGAIPGSPGRIWRLAWISYLSAGGIACVAAVFDPRGADQVYKSVALVSFLSAAGLLLVPRLPERSPLPPEPVTRSLGWILAALLAAVVFVGALGPGIRVSL